MLKHDLSTMMEKYIPTKMISHNINILWFKKLINELPDINVEPMTRQKGTNSPGDWEVYGKLRRSLDRSLRKCRSEHLKVIGDNLMISNSKPFWKFIKSHRQSSTG